MTLVSSKKAVHNLLVNKKIFSCGELWGIQKSTIFTSQFDEGQRCMVL